ncbi:MAG: siderophore-interacting protein [Candidatus Dormibacteraeota bacterium]|nr:siderophore-interacting protein [Candidatus Dormibacteraeota bacterium]
MSSPIAPSLSGVGYLAYFTVAGARGALIEPGLAELVLPQNPQSIVQALPMPAQRELDLVVSEVKDLTRSMRCIKLQGEALEGFDFRPGQDLMVRVPLEGRLVNRRYSIRRYDPSHRTLDIEVVLHGGGPGARWATEVARGDPLEQVVAPRGKITLDPGAEWHIFIGDETAMPAIFNMAEALPSGQRAAALLEVGGHEDELEPPASLVGGLDWIRRGGAPGDDQPLIRAVQSLALPGGAGRVYLAGEARTVITIRDLLVARGQPRERLAVKAYWRRDQPNLDRGEPLSED